MVTSGDCTYHGERGTTYRLVESPCGTPETNVVQQFNFLKNVKEKVASELRLVREKYYLQRSGLGARYAQVKGRKQREAVKRPAEGITCLFSLPFFLSSCRLLSHPPRKEAKRPPCHPRGDPGDSPSHSSPPAIALHLVLWPQWPALMNGTDQVPLPRALSWVQLKEGMGWRLQSGRKETWRHYPSSCLGGIYKLAVATFLY